MIALKLKNDLLVPQEKDKNGLKRIIKINNGKDGFVILGTKLRLDLGIVL